MTTVDEARAALLDTPYGDGWTMGDHAAAVERFEAAVRAEYGEIELACRAAIKALRAAIAATPAEDEEGRT